jgi:hypothetical protein
MDGPKDRPFSYTKSSAVQFSAGYGSCKSVFQSSVQELVQVGCSRRFSFSLLCQDDEVNKEMALLHVGHVRDQQRNGMFPCALLATPIQSICDEEEEDDSRDL